MGKLVALMNQWEQFQSTHPDGSLHQFGNWLTTRGQPQVSEAKAFRADDPEFQKHHEQAHLPLQAGYLVGKLYQYLLIYTKPLMRQFGLHSMDDFGYLATIEWHGTITKSKACQAMLQEITTGTDIIRRLIALKYVKEIIDKTDRRQKLLQLTANGKKVLTGLQQGFVTLPDLLGELEIEQRRTLVDWLMNLDTYHNNILKARK